MPFGRLGRRSRFKRTPTGKRIVLTNRDIEIMRWLYRYRYLRVAQLVAFLKPKSEKRFVERLGDLFHETGLVDRPKAQWRCFDPRCTPLIYEVSAKGIDCLSARDQLPLRATTLSRRKRPGTTPQFKHAMMIVDALSTIELETIEKPGVRFVCVDEILNRSPERTRMAKNPLAVPVTITPSSQFPTLRSKWQTHIIPDALFGIEYLIDGEKLYRFWALECENTTPKNRKTSRQSSTLRKEAAYEELINSRQYRSHWGIPNLKINIIRNKFRSVL